MNLKNQLKLHLSHSEIKASELARRAKVPRQSISDWLGGSKPRNIDSLKKIADALNVTIDHLLFGDGLPKESDAAPIPVTSGESEEWMSGIYEVKFRKVTK